ncbi:hypothetical protein [Flavisolibacter tropicus]|uniref:ABC transporter Uup C-terminal domain-containing protein n=1 Tax=Flavisolibacter tropicus TaxID=1492898 RepID=A0A172TUZ9_9BACT|nr:hypothetical protein [Flavisolibacter tropicus]ANE50798.1 hypothetical protein SY85_10075 [Flavisolibacter tropicus]
MFFNQSDLDNEIRELHLKLDEKRKAFDEGMKSNMSFEDLRVLYAEIKALAKRQDLLFEESNLQKGWED